MCRGTRAQGAITLLRSDSASRGADACAAIPALLPYLLPRAPAPRRYAPPPDISVLYLPPAPHVRSCRLPPRSAATADEWVAYLRAAAAGEIKAIAGTHRRAKGGEGEDLDEADQPEHVPPAPGFLIRQEGLLHVTAPGGDGRATARMYVVLDPDSRLLLVFSDASRAPGSERAVVDMLSASVTVEPPPGGPPLEDPAAAARAVYISVDDAGMYGGGAPGAGGGAGGARTAAASSSASATTATSYTASVLLAPSSAERDVWLACLAAACDPTTVVQLQDEAKAAAAATSPLLAPTLLHVQLRAGLLAALGAPAERRVALDAGDKTLTVFADARGGARVARALKLTAPGVRIDFACDAGAVAPGWSRLRIEVTAPAANDARPAPALQTHVLRTRGYEAYAAWASAMAAL